MLIIVAESRKSRSSFLRHLANTVKGMHARARSARRRDAKQSRHCTLEARGARKRDGAFGEGRRGRTFPSTGRRRRTISAPRLARSESRRTGRRVWRRRSRPIALRWRKGRKSAFRSTGRRRRTISALRSGRWAVWSKDSNLTQWRRSGRDSSSYHLIRN